MTLVNMVQYMIKKRFLLDRSSYHGYRRLVLNSVGCGQKANWRGRANITTSIGVPKYQVVDPQIPFRILFHRCQATANAAHGVV